MLSTPLNHVQVLLLRFEIFAVGLQWDFHVPSGIKTISMKSMSYDHLSVGRQSNHYFQGHHTHVFSSPMPNGIIWPHTKKKCTNFAIFFSFYSDNGKFYFFFWGWKSLDRKNLQSTASYDNLRLTGPHGGIYYRRLEVGHETGWPLQFLRSHGHVSRGNIITKCRKLRWYPSLPPPHTPTDCILS